MSFSSQLVKIFVPGVPIQQGSKNQFGAESNAAKLKPWRAAVTQIAHAQMDGRPVHEGPVWVVVTFDFPRPQAHFRTNGSLKEGAPRYKAGTPDLDKLQRAIGDALTGVVFHDDKQIVRWHAVKGYDHNHPGAHIGVYAL